MSNCGGYEWVPEHGHIRPMVIYGHILGVSDAVGMVCRNGSRYALSASRISYVCPDAVIDVKPEYKGSKSYIFRKRITRFVLQLFFLRRLDKIDPYTYVSG
jgi:hypothetical protein